MYKLQNYNDAIKLYNKSLLWTETNQNVEDFRISCYLNLSLAYLKMKEYNKSIEEATRVIQMQPKNVKALYRRGSAYLSFFMFEEAKLDFLEALNIEPNNKNVINEYNNLLKCKEESQKKQKNVFGSLFQKEYYDSVEKSEYSQSSNPIIFFKIKFIFFKYNN